jgi:hypothetical protein
MDRRSFLGAGAALSATAAFAGRSLAGQELEAQSFGWRTFEVTSRIEIPNPEGVTQVWLPLPSVDAPAWATSASCSNPAICPASAPT